MLTDVPSVQMRGRFLQLFLNPFFYFQGGFGVAKNLCSWAVEGKDCTVNELVKSTLKAFHSAKKPIGLCCISPVLAAKVFPGCEVTVGHSKNVDGR